VNRRRESFLGAAVIITGGASGIGLAMGAELAAHGAHVVLADFDGERAEREANELDARDATSGSVSAAMLDVRDRAAVKSLVDAVAGRHGQLDFMFNNAGIVIGGRSDTMSGEHWDRVIDVNLMGVVNGVVAAYPMMAAQSHGHIVNTASTAGLAPAAMVAAYSASKHAVVGLSGALRAEAATVGVRVSVVCPGAVDTPILDAGPPEDLPPPTAATMTGREYMAVVGLKPIPAERFARAALRGVARNHGVIVAPASAKAVWYLQRMAPGLVEMAGRRTARRVNHQLAIRPGITPE
jgi:NAD(P)-dependent dehydrogenase (short-subunit alcohol dehydrogenase family)